MVYIRHLSSPNRERSTWQVERSILADKARFPDSKSDLACFERQVEQHRRNPQLEALSERLRALATESVAWRRRRAEGSHILVAIVGVQDHAARST